MRRYVNLALLSMLIILLHLVRAQHEELEWRDEAQKVAREALEKKYSHLVTSESNLELFRYSTPSSLQRSAHSFTYIVTPKDDSSNTHRCDIIISRYKGQLYSFVFGEPTCYKVVCTNEKVAGYRKQQKICRKP